MAAVQLQRYGAAPGDAGYVRGSEGEVPDQRRQAVRVVRQPEVRLHVGGAPRTGLVPGGDREVVSQRGELRPPGTPVLSPAVHEHERRTVAHALVGDLEPVRSQDLHCRNRPGIGVSSGLCA